MLVVVVPFEDAPRGAPTVELESHKKAVLVTSLAIDDLSIRGWPLVEKSNLNYIPWLPTMSGADTNAIGTKIIGVGFFFDFAGVRGQRR